MRVWVAALLVSCAACSASETIDVNVDSAKAALVVWLSPSGHDRIEAIDLVPADGGRLSTQRGEDGDELFVIPYGCPLERLGLDAGAVEIAIDELRPAIPPTSRKILHAVMTDGSDVRFDEESAMPRVLTDIHLLRDKATSSCCPQNIVEGTVSLSFGACQSKYCETRVSKNPDTCELSIDPSACADQLGATLGALTARIESGGLVIASPPAGAQCQAVVPARPYAAASFDCTAPVSCPIDIRLPPNPLFSVTSADVIPGAQNFGAALPDLSYRETRNGYLADMIVLLDRVVVASFDGQLVERAADLCGAQTPPTKFHFFDPTTMVETGNAIAPPCSLVLARDPTGSGFLSAHAVRDDAQHGYQFFVVRYDASGVELSRSAPIFVALANDADTLRPAALIADVDAPHAVYLATASSGGAEADKLFTFAAPDDLQLTKTVELGGAVGVIGFVNVGSAGDLAWVEHETEAVRWLDTPALPALAGPDPGELGFHGTSNTLVVPSMSAFAGISAVRRDDRGGERVQPVPPFESNAGFASAVTWPSDQMLSIAGGIADFSATRASNDAVIALYAPEAHTFVPGMQRIGWGPVRKLGVGPEARVFGILPWSGQLVRIVAR